MVWVLLYYLPSTIVIKGADNDIIILCLITCIGVVVYNEHTYNMYVIRLW